MKNIHYNNIGICSAAISAILEQRSHIDISKILLILPIIMDKELLNYLGKKRIKIISLERLIIDKLNCFTNFNDRFIGSLTNSLNAIQFLHEMELIKITGSKVFSLNKLDANKIPGQRTEKIQKASSNIALLLDGNPANLYLNLRVKL